MRTPTASRIALSMAAAVSISHDLASARTIGDEIAMLHDGRIVWRGSPAELDHSDNPLLRQFVDGRAEGPMTPDA